MHGVTAKVTQEVIVLLQDDNPDSGAGEQERVNEAGGAPTGNTNLGLKDFRHGPTLPRARISLPPNSPVRGAGTAYGLRYEYPLA